MSRFMRDLATGGASCEPADGAGPSGQTQNPIARVANVVLGDRGGGARASNRCKRLEHRVRVVAREGSRGSRVVRRVRVTDEWIRAFSPPQSKESSPRYTRRMG